MHEQISLLQVLYRTRIELCGRERKGPSLIKTSLTLGVVWNKQSMVAVTQVLVQHLLNHLASPQQRPSRRRAGDLAALLSISATNFEPPRSGEKEQRLVLGQQKCRWVPGGCSSWWIALTHLIRSSSPFWLQRRPNRGPAEAPVASQGCRVSPAPSPSRVRP